MGSITDLSNLANIITGGTGYRQPIWQLQDARQAAAAGAVCVVGQWTSLWNFNKSPGGQGTAPGGTARNPTNATAGALGQADATGGRENIFIGWGCYGITAGVFQLHDRLADYSTLSGTTTTAQTISGLSVTRYTGSESVGNEIWLEIWTIIGTTATTVTVEYTNQAGTTGQISQAVVIGGTGRREATRIIKVPLAAGDTGVRAVTNIDLLATTGTAGDIGVVIARPLAEYPIDIAGSGGYLDLLTAMPTMPKIKAGACIDKIWYAGSATSPYSYQQLSIIEA